MTGNKPTQVERTKHTVYRMRIKQKSTVRRMQAKKYLLLALSLALAASLCQPVESAKRKSRGGGGGGGLYLSTPNPQTPVEHNNRGVELGQKGLWSDAIREHEIALQMDPHNSQWRTNLSAAHLEYGKRLAAAKKDYPACIEFRKAMVTDPANAQADAELENTLRRTGKLGRTPEEAYANRAKLAHDAYVSGDWDTAIVEYRHLAKVSDTPNNRAQLGRVFIKAGKTVEGFKELRTAVGRSDWTECEKMELADTHRELGDILKDFALKAKDQGKGQKGMQRLWNAGVEYRRAVTIYPGNLAAVEGLVQCAQMALAVRNSFDNHLFLGGAYLLAGKFANAQMEYKECYKLKPDNPELSAARIAYHQAVARMDTASQEQVADSVEKVKKLIETDQDNPRLWYILGRLREHQGEFEKAKKSYDKALSINKHIDPDLQQGLIRLGVAVPAEKAPEAAAKTQEQSQEALHKLLAEKDFTDLQNMLDGGKLDDAINKGQELFSKYQKDGRYPRVIGRANEKKGDADSLNTAKTWYRMGAGLGDEMCQRFLEQIDSSLVAEKLKSADELAKAGKYLDAKDIYQDILTKTPRRGDIHRKLGDCLKELGDKEGAKKEYQDADSFERGETPKASDPTQAAPETPAASAEADQTVSNAGSDKKATGEKSKAKNSKSAEKQAKPPEEQGLKADSLQMQPMKRKK